MYRLDVFEHAWVKLTIYIDNDNVTMKTVHNGNLIIDTGY